MARSRSADQDTNARLLLLEHAERISGGAERHCPIKFHPDTWRRWVRGTSVEDATEKVLADLPPGEVCRADLRNFACDADSPTGRLELFIATLIWGRGPRNARMRPHILKALTHQDRDGVLAATQGRVLSDKLAEAYEAWKLPGLRAPFFTKWLWASSLTRPPDERALILDSRVFATLNGPLGWSSVVAAGSSRRSLRYRAYVDAARSWARHLTENDHLTTAEDIEWALFTANGDLTRLENK
jgi:hypothetical protein